MDFPSRRAWVIALAAVVSAATSASAGPVHFDGCSGTGRGAFRGGGEANVAAGVDSAVVGGKQNAACADYAGIVVGTNNLVSSAYGFIGGGVNNGASADGAAVVAGNDNAATGPYAVVGAGISNVAGGYTAFVGGGASNTAPGIGAVVGGGDVNTATGINSTIAGGYLNIAQGAGSFAAGRSAHAMHDGSFVWSDQVTSSPVTTTAVDQFVVRASGGVTFYSSANFSTGVTLPAGSGAWSSLSDRRAKTGIVPVDVAVVLAKVAALPVREWSYAAQGGGVRHVGPMAQDFKAAFGLGEDDRHIATIDEGGIALAAIQGLHAENAALRARLARDEAQLAILRAQMGRLARLR
jgi:hypothetical protein